MTKISRISTRFMSFTTIATFTFFFHAGLMYCMENDMLAWEAIDFEEVIIPNCLESIHIPKELYFTDEDVLTSNFCYPYSTIVRRSTDSSSDSPSTQGSTPRQEPKSRRRDVVEK